MLQVFVFGFIVAVCSAVTPVTLKTPATPAPVLCGYTPDNIYNCLGNPKIIPADVPGQCETTVSECERMKCVFRKLGWLESDKLNTKKTTEYFDKFSRDHSEWSHVVDHVKSMCLSAPLRPQGVYVNCEPYDVMMCILTQFIKHAQPNQWSTASECTYPRQYAASCPVCPSDCFAPAVPYGSCNACVLLPRSP